MNMHPMYFMEAAKVKKKQYNKIILFPLHELRGAAAPKMKKNYDWPKDKSKSLLRNRNKVLLGFVFAQVVNNFDRVLSFKLDN